MEAIIRKYLQSWLDKDIEMVKEIFYRFQPSRHSSKWISGCEWICPVLPVFIPLFGGIINKTSKLSNFILHQSEGLHKL